MLSYVYFLSSSVWIEGQFCVAFITAVICQGIEQASQAIEEDTNTIMQELDQCYLLRMPTGFYVSFPNLGATQFPFLSYLGVSTACLYKLISHVNSYNANIVQSQVRELPAEHMQKPKRGAPRKVKVVQEKVKGQPGRPKGSKNKSTLLREELEAKLPPKPKRKPGRPKGSKNKKTIIRESLASQQAPSSKE